MRLRDFSVGIHVCQYMTTGSSNLRLHESLVRRPRRREGRQEIIGLILRRVVVINRADSHDIRHVAGNTHGHCTRTCIASRGHHDYPCFPCRHHGLIQGVIPVVRLWVGAKGQIEHPNA